MPFRMLHELFPEVAERETRCIIVPTSEGGLPAGTYAFKEMFCDEPGCDCRRVFFWVDTPLCGEPEAVIAWGWEDLPFYEAWLKYGDKSEAKALQGPILDPGSPETALAPRLLELFQEVLLPNPDYTARVKRHYELFRDAIEAGGTAGKPAGGRAARARGAKRARGGDGMNDTRDPRNGECLLCHAVIPRAKAARHVAACLAAKPVEAGRQVKALHLRVAGRYHPEYWLHLEIASALDLYELDAFLRQTWLECCGHLSCFTIAGQRYAYDPCQDSFTGRRERSLESKLYKVIAPGTEFTYEYDYGSTTELVLKALGAHEAALDTAGVRILARNVPPDVRCAACQEPATIVEAGWGGLNLERCFCQTCAASRTDDQGMRLPIVNSPRVGVCAYCG